MNHLASMMNMIDQVTNSFSDNDGQLGTYVIRRNDGYYYIGHESATDKTPVFGQAASAFHFMSLYEAESEIGFMPYDVQKQVDICWPFTGRDIDSYGLMEVWE